MNLVEPITLASNGVRLEPLAPEHATGLSEAAADGELWTLNFTSVPGPGEEVASIETAQAMPDRVAFAVLDDEGTVLGSTSYHDILDGPRRVEIGYTWYAARVQRTYVNTTCKLLLMRHAFEALECVAVGWRTDEINLRSQAAIERLGATRDGALRGHRIRRDGTVGATVFYSVTAPEWPAVKERLQRMLDES